MKSLILVLVSRLEAIAFAIDQELLLWSEQLIKATS